MSKSQTDNQKFSKSAKLSDKRQFKRFYNNPSVFKLGFLSIFWITNNKNTARLGVTLKTRAINPGTKSRARPSSVFRNAIKRVVREWFRKTKAKMPCYDLNVVVIVTQDLKGLERKNFLKSLNTNLEKAAVKLK